VQAKVLEGTMHLRLTDTSIIAIDLVGTLTDLTPGAGAVVLVGDRLDLSLDSPLQLLGIHVPLLDIDVHVGLRIDLAAYFGYPEPIAYCSSSPNSVGAGAVLLQPGIAHYGT
jgi:hypothetical protein